MDGNYISVSGVSEVVQLGEIARICEEIDFERNLVIGYQVSNKSVNEWTRNPRQPAFLELGQLDEMTLDFGMTSAIHYYTRDNNTIVNDLKKVIDTGVEPSEALVQFNTLPPSRKILEGVKAMGWKTIFKVAVSNKGSAEKGYKVWKGNEVQDVKSGDVYELVQQVLDRKDLVDYAMFDPSHGTNLGLDLGSESLAVRFGQEMISRGFEGGLVYAGGIGPQNVRQVTGKLEDYFPGRWSIDTESKVRMNDVFDFVLFRDYLVGCNW